MPDGHGGWHARLDLRYRRDGERTIGHDRHEGPLRVLRSLYPEGPGICHQVIVHPPGGIAGGDVLEIEAELGADSHALLTTPGAARFYRSDGPIAAQRVRLRAAAGARIEWLPLETIAYRGCRAENHLEITLAAGAELIGWDLLALGLPASGAPFDDGSFLQQIALGEEWLERGRIEGHDQRLLASPLGWAGRRVLATMWFAAGEPLAESRREALLAAAREASDIHTLHASAGSTAPRPSIVVLRVLAARAEPAMDLLRQVWTRWRHVAWALPASPPRVWQT